MNLPSFRSINSAQPLPGLVCSHTSDEILGFHIRQVFVVLGCFVALLVRIRPHWPSVFMGFIPSKALFETKPDAVYAGTDQLYPTYLPELPLLAVGILGATVMPHALLCEVNPPRFAGLTILPAWAPISRPKIGYLLQAQ